MKKLKIAICLMLVVNSITTMAKCNQRYDEYISKKAFSSAFSTTGTPTTGYVGFGAFIVGGWGGSLPIALLGLASTTAAPIMLGKGISNVGVALSLKSVSDLIHEAEVGMGASLVNITEELSEDLERDVSEERVIDLINIGNKSEIFCYHENRLPFGKLEVYNYLKKNLE